MSRKTELYEAYADDARLALDAWANLDPVGFAAWQATVEERQYLADYRRWNSRRTVGALTTSPESADLPLFPLPPKSAPPKPVPQVRQTIVHDGRSIDLLALAGEDGARILRETALRDKGPASTTLARCDRMVKLAELIAAESKRLGRPVSVAEVIERVAA